MLVNFLENKGFCKAGDIVEMGEDQAEGLINRNIVEKAVTKGAKKESTKTIAK